MTHRYTGAYKGLMIFAQDPLTLEVLDKAIAQAQAVPMQTIRHLERQHHPLWVRMDGRRLPRKLKKKLFGSR
jgi:hypothetical protein